MRDYSSAKQKKMKRKLIEKIDARNIQDFKSFLPPEAQVNKQTRFDMRHKERGNVSNKDEE